MEPLLQRIIDARIAEHHRVVEKACEMALLSGHMGVIVVDDNGITRAKPSRMVPYGEMFSFPSMDAHQRWFENTINETKES